MNRVPRTALSVAIAVLALAGCTYSGPPPWPSSYCLPRFTVEPAVVSPGESITMTATDECDVTPPGSGWVVLVAPVGQPASGVSTTVTDGFDGSFSVTVEIPATFPSGEAFASIENWDYSPCDDTSVNGAGSCASASASFTVR
jgi:hypothetical protein